MNDLEQLQQKFSVPSLRFRRGGGGFLFLDIRNRFASATVCAHGAHLTDFAPAGERPVLWMSRHSWFEPGKPIRGGVPVCWPWFGAASDPALPSHGFARVSEWRVAGASEKEDGATHVALTLAPEDVKSEFGAFPFSLELEIAVGAALEVKLTMVNRSDRVQLVSDALHSYFSVGDIAKTRLRGLDGTTYADRVPGAPRERVTQHGDIVIDREVDRVYLDTTAAVEILDAAFDRTIRVEKSGSRSTVVWNPWIAKSRRMPDFGDDEYRTMVCVETANNLSDTLRLAPEARHAVAQRISVTPGIRS